jgi:hypothetical protein
MDFYTTNISKNPFNSKVEVTGEPDLREEIKRILYDEKRGSYFIYRRVRRDAEGYPLLAPSSITNRSAEPTFGTNKGMKHLFDDYIVLGYLSTGTTFHDTGSVKEYGDSRSDKITIFLEHDVLKKITNNNKDMPTTDDKIFVPEIDIDGTVMSPLKSLMMYNIGSPEAYRLDVRGRVEFFRLNLISSMDNSIQL